MSAEPARYYSPSKDPIADTPATRLKTAQEKLDELLKEFYRVEEGRFECPDGRVIYWGRADNGLFNYTILGHTPEEPQREDVNVNGLSFSELPAALQRAIEQHRDETAQKKKDRAEAKAIKKVLRTVEAVDPELNDPIQRLIYDYRHLIRYGRVRIGGKMWIWFIEYNELLKVATISYQEGDRGEFISDVYPEVVPVKLIRSILARLDERLRELGSRDADAHQTLEKAMHDKVAENDAPMMRLAKRRRWAKA